MFASELIEDIPNWLTNKGPQTDCVISTRVRLARNLANHIFPYKASFLERKNIFDLLSKEIGKLTHCKNSTCLNFVKTEGVDQEFLLENRMVSSDLINGEGDRGVVYNASCGTSIMINEEDHIRMQCLESGYQPDKVWDRLNEIDDELGERVHFAFEPKRGFLTSCPTNSGTGLRMSFLLHLPGLVLTQTIDSVLTAASQMGLATRGFFGEHSEVVGNFFQLSNQTTMGMQEGDLLANTQKVVEKIIKHEHEARERVVTEAENELLDKIYRSYGILKYARTLALDEFLNLSSALRFGIECGIIKEMSIEALNHMILRAMPAHIHIFRRQKLDRGETDKVRASLIKEMIPEIG